MATVTKRTAEAEPQPLWEVVTRRPDGHETLLRTYAPSGDAAVDMLEQRGMDRDQVVEARKAGT